MKTKKTYAEKLKDPRWQKLRLSVLGRNDFICELCDETEKELQVHHVAYRKNAEPWAYDESELIALCVDCHKSVTRKDLFFREVLLCDPSGAIYLMDLIQRGVLDEAGDYLAEMMVKAGRKIESYRLGFSSTSRFMSHGVRRLKREMEESK